MLQCCTHAKYCCNSGHQNVQLVDSDKKVLQEEMSWSRTREAQQNLTITVISAIQRTYFYQCNIVIPLTII